MIKHVVLWNVKEEAMDMDKEQIIRELTERLRELDKKLDMIEALEVGTDITHGDASADFILTTIFKNREDLQRYREHPEHLKVVEFIKNVTNDRKVIDYEV